MCLALLLGLIPIYGGNADAAAPGNEPQLVAGYYHNVGLTTNGSVWGWGGNEKGGLADGTNVNRSIPVAAQGMTGVASIAAGVRQSFAIKKDGTVWAWGSNNYGQLGDGTKTDRWLPVQIAIGDVASLSGGIGYHTLALKKDGTVWAWGDNGNGELGDGTLTDRSVPAEIPGLANMIAVSAGGYHSIALKADGTVWAWGLNSSGEMGNGTESVAQTTPVRVSGLDHVVAISAGNYHNLALKENGTVWAWGDNDWGALGDGTTTKRIVPVQVNGLSGVKAVSAGGWHSIALKTDGTVWTWGYNKYGQVGDGTLTNRNAPVQLSGLSEFVQIAAGAFHSAALRKDGSVWSWGLGSYGQHGNASSADTAVPVQSKAWLDGTTPDVASGTIAASGVTTNSATLTWAKATDNMTEQSGLQYRVYRSFKSNIQSVADIESKGIVVNAYTADIDSLALTGLLDGMPYYFNVIVKDKAGNKTAYGMQQVVTVAIPTYSVIYRGNGSTGGTVPVDDYTYYEGEEAEVLGNAGGLVRAAYTFANWNTKADGTGEAYAEGDLAPIGHEDLVLYAQWTKNPPYKVIYEGNGETGGPGPNDDEEYGPGAAAIVMGNAGGFVKSGYAFAGWNTKPDGGGTPYSAGETLTIGADDVTLYAQWTAITTYRVTYEAGDTDSGSVPVDAGAYEEGAEVTVRGNPGNLAKAGFDFVGWTLSAEGTGTVYKNGDKLTMGASDLTLYAKWEIDAGPGPDPVAAPKLSSLHLSAGVWSTAFASDTTAYTITLPEEVPSVDITSAAANERQSVTASVYDGEGLRIVGPVELGAESERVSLIASAASLQIAVVAEDGRALKYTLQIKREKAQDPATPTPIPTPSPTPTPPPFKLTIGGAEQSLIGAATMNAHDLDVQLRSSALTTGLTDAAEGTSIAITAPDDALSLTVRFDAAALNAMKEKRALLQLVTAQGSYTLPITDLPPVEAAAGATYSLTVGRGGEGTALQLSQAATDAGYAIIGSPVSFELKVDDAGRATVVDSFKSFVKRELPLPAGADPTGVTAVAVEPDGTLRPVPTEIVARDGRYYAVVRSLTNSAYALVRSTAQDFADLSGHWAREAIADMAARLIVYGYSGGEFRPNAAVSRAEFAAMLIRALGLPQTANGTNAFADIKAGAWYGGAVEQAAAYSLLLGGSDGRFRPDETITREEAFAVIARAAKLAGIQATAATGDADRILLAFADGDAIHGWAREDVAGAVQEGLVQGAGGRLDPTGSVTRAETATMLRRLLVQAGLIQD